MTIKILLVDDNPTFLTAIRGFFDRLPGTEVIAEARDGREALTKAEKLQPDLVLMDIAMPELNGLNAARAMQYWPSPPYIVFLSMNDSEAYRAAARGLGASGFVSKSNFVIELLPIIDQIVIAKEKGHHVHES